MWSLNRGSRSSRFDCIGMCGIEQVKVKSKVEFKRFKCS